MTLRVISGAQTGADVAGLWAAKLFGIPTGGWAPKDFITLDGPHPEMAQTFGIKEHSKAGYRDRTIANLTESSSTIVCSEKMSPGTKLTINQCKKTYVPCHVFMLDPSDLQGSIDEKTIDNLVHEISRSNKLGLEYTLNVAGNATKNCARAFEFTFKICHKLFTELGYTSTVGDWEWNRYKDTWK